MVQLTGSRAADAAYLLQIRRNRIITAEQYREAKAALERQQVGVNKRAAAAAAKREEKKAAAKAAAAEKRKAKREAYLNELINVNGTITAQVRWENKYDGEEFTRVRTFSYIVPRREVKATVRDLVTVETKMWEEDSDLIVNKKTIQAVINQDKVNNNPDVIQHVPMREAGALRLDGEEHYEFDSGNGTCVFDFLEWRYGQLPRCKKVARRANLVALFGEEALEKGVTAADLTKFADAAGCALYALDETNNIFLNYIPADRKGEHAPPLCFRVKNNHFYPIIKEARSIANTVTATSLGQKKVKKEEETVEAAPLKVEYVKSDDPMGFLVAKCRELGTEVYSRAAPKIAFDDDGLANFVLGDTKFMFDNCDMIKQAMKIAELNGEEYTGQSIHTYIYRITSELKMGKLSALNPHAQAALSSKQAKDRTHYGMRMKMPKDAYACDIAKCYTSCIMAPMDDWMIFSPQDEWKQFEWAETLQPGFYYVETDDMTLLHGSNVYSYTMVRKAMEERIISRNQIKFQLLASSVLPADYFQPFLEAVDKLCKGDAGLKKTLVNLFIGNMGKSTSKRVSARMDTDANTVWRAFKSESEGKFFSHERDGYYIYGHQTYFAMSENNLPMYLQVLDQANIRLYDMIKMSGATLVGRKTDCAILSGGSELFKTMLNGVAPGSYRVSSIPKMGKERSAADRAMPIELVYPLEWVEAEQSEIVVDDVVMPAESAISSSNQIEEAAALLKKNGGLMLIGRAGTGKSHMLRGLAAKYTNAVKMAFTNKAALNVGGSTIHKFLKIDSAGKAAIWALKRKYKNKEVLFCVDEASMINGALWRMLIEVKRALPNAHWVICGDYRQLPPIEDIQVDWFDSSVMKFLTACARVELTECQRYDEDLWNASNAIETAKWDRTIVWGGRHLCYFNATRKSINTKLNEHRGIFVPFTGKKTDQQQDAYLYPGLPVIAHMNYSAKQGQVTVNSEQFTVVSADEVTTTVMSQRPEGEHTWSFPTAEFHKFFLLNFATTVHRAQGETIDGDVTVWDWASMDEKMKYTAVTRARKMTQVHVA